MEAVVVPTATRLDLEYPEHVQPPFTIMIEDIHDPVQGYHQHIDMIYFCRPAGELGAMNDGWRWIGRDALRAGTPIQRDGGPSEVAPEDVRLLAEYAFALIEG